MCKGGTGGNPQPVRPVEINKFKGRTIMAKEMIAMILAGGQGSRLYALTQKLAKPAVPFGGKYRIIDFKRNKDGVPAKVATIEYDPNRSANIALLNYADGEKRYIIAPLGLKVGDTLLSGEGADIKVGNAMQIRQIPVGTMIHCIEIKPGKGAQIARSAGNAAQLMAKEGAYAQVRLPRGEVRLIPMNAKATIGQVGNVDHENIKLGKAGRTRHKGFRPTVRGSVMNPCDHPHGGGEGRAPVGHDSPRTPWGKPAMGLKTRKHHARSNKCIVKRANG